MLNMLLPNVKRIAVTKSALVNSAICLQFDEIVCAAYNNPRTVCVYVYKKYMQYIEMFDRQKINNKINPTLLYVDGIFSFVFVVN